MLRCREVTRLYASEEVLAAPLRVRLAAWLHLRLCRHCRRYVRELARIGQAVRDLYHDVEDHADRDEALIRRVLPGGDPPPS